MVGSRKVRLGRKLCGSLYAGNLMNQAGSKRLLLLRYVMSNGKIRKISRKYFGPNNVNQWPINSGNK